MDSKPDAPSAETEELTSDGNRRFGPYILLHAVGAGGMGRVHIAVSGRPGMAKLCVLKRMSNELGSPEQEARFRREAAVALRLSHGAIAQTFSVDEIEGELCILQELVQGVSLSHLLRTCRSAATRLPIETAIHIARELARALAYAHGLEGGGIIHRDVTPDNVMLSYGGEVKLIDFGIAKALGEASLTQLGMVVGRRTHTAPEVLAGRPADARSDLYSLGVLLWQALTGRSPPEAPAAASGPSALPAPSSYEHEISAELDEIVKDLLAEEPDDRFQTAEELQEALGSFLPGGFVGERDVARLLARTYDVDRERTVLAAEVARAQKLLGAAAPEPAAVVKPEPAAAVTPEPVAVVTPEPVAVVTPEPVAVVTPEPAPAPAKRSKTVTASWPRSSGRKAPKAAANMVAKTLQRHPQGGSTERVRWRDGRWSVAVAGLAGATVVAIVLALFHEGAPTSNRDEGEPPVSPEAAAPGFLAGTGSQPAPAAVATPPAVPTPPAAGVVTAPAPGPAAPLAAGGTQAPALGVDGAPAPPSVPAVSPAVAPVADSPAVAPVPPVAARPEAPSPAEPDLAMGAPLGRGKGRTPVPSSASERRPLPGDTGAAAPKSPVPKVVVDPKTAAELLARAERSFDVGDVAQALALARAAARAGGGQRAHMIAGKALLAEGKLTEAEGELVQAVRLAPGDIDAAALLDRVRARRVRHGGQ